MIQKGKKGDQLKFDIKWWFDNNNNNNDNNNNNNNNNNKDDNDTYDSKLRYQISNTRMILIRLRNIVTNKDKKN